MRPQVILSIRVYADELEIFQEYANLKGKSLSGSIHDLALEAAKQALEKEQTKS